MSEQPEQWQGSEAQQEQILEGVTSFARKAVSEIENVVGNHDNLHPEKKRFTEEEIAVLMHARGILMKLKNKQ